jgi:hypothetical protein
MKCSRRWDLVAVIGGPRTIGSGPRPSRRRTKLKLGSARVFGRASRGGSSNAARHDPSTIRSRFVSASIDGWTRRSSSSLTSVLSHRGPSNQRASGYIVRALIRHTFITTSTDRHGYSTMAKPTRDLLTSLRILAGPRPIFDEEERMNEACFAANLAHDRSRRLIRIFPTNSETLDGRSGRCVCFETSCQVTGPVDEVQAPRNPEALPAPISLC